MAFLTQNIDKLWKILIITLVFWEKRHFFRRKLSKIAENCDHNIDPWSPWLHVAGEFVGKTRPNNFCHNSCICKLNNGKKLPKMWTTYSCYLQVTVQSGHPMHMHNSEKFFAENNWQFCVHTCKRENSRLKKNIPALYPLLHELMRMLLTTLKLNYIKYVQSSRMQIYPKIFCRKIVVL
jgi:hypothetical protein